MKATINGVTIEGTPQEIAEYQRIVEAQANVKKTEVPWEPYVKPVITCGETQAITKDYAWNGPVATLYGGERYNGEIIKR